MAIDFSALAKDVEHLGARRALTRAAYYRASALTGVALYRVLALTRAGVNQELLARAARHEIRVLSRQELVHFSADPENRLPAGFVAAAAEREDFCVGVLEEGALASFGWYARLPTVVEDGAAIHFDASHVYMFHGYTRPEHRGAQLHGIGLVRAMQIFAERGYTAVVTLADWANHASLGSAHRVGYRPLGVALRAGKGVGCRLWSSPGCRRYGVHLAPAGERLYSVHQD